MKLTTNIHHGRTARPTHIFAGRPGGLLTRHRLARRWPEDGERMVTAADMRAFGL
ncbi:hypothetical protein [Williamsia sp. Leaf354]|uniref:hypothetical protein n=1 Tax=Williamsia sp. Leaf354 TaxID=1736349 RepID=UPI000ACFF399|nr:hypothetical protein [Williamsia sp. Leaf354]